MDPTVGENDLFYAHLGIIVRLTRNLDKDRGFVNGTAEVVERILAYDNAMPIVLTVKICTGVMVRVHPIFHDTRCFVPCTYGYATTIRRAQGDTSYHGCIWFNRCYPPERGYGYVAASRFKSKSGMYLFGKGRATDWLPVRARDDETYDETNRGDQSQSSCDSAEEEADTRQYETMDSRSDYDEGSDDDEFNPCFEDMSDTE